VIRRVDPEWLDELPQDDPRAQRSRRDLRRLNTFMSSARLVARELRGARLASVAEIGAGDGMFAAHLAASLARHGAPGQFVLLDRQATPSKDAAARFESHGWQMTSKRADVFEWLADPATKAFDAIVANLFLHHFDDARLATLLRLAAARTSLFVACEPQRSGIALAGSRMLGLLGCNDVTRHDAVVSVRAGFEGREISALWPATGWRVGERMKGFVSHVFTARRDAAC